MMDNAFFIFDFTIVYGLSKIAVEQALPTVWNFIFVRPELKQNLTEVEVMKKAGSNWSAETEADSGKKRS
jgi:hypothetical protein